MIIASSATNTIGKQRPFTLRDKLGYGAGDFGNDLTFVLVGTFFMIFATNVAGVRAAAAGTILLLARLVDAFFDIAMGRLADILPATPHGKYRPWIRRMAIPVSVLATLCFAPWMQHWNPTAALIWLGVAYFCYGISYSALNIPYGAMATVISPHPADRSSLSVFRSLGAVLAGTAVMALSNLVYTSDSTGRELLNANRMFASAAACGLTAIIFQFFCYATSVERVETPTKPKGERANFLTVVATMAHNRALLAIIVASLLLVVAVASLQGLQSYLWLDYFRNAKMQMWGGLALLAPTLLVAPFATKIGQRYGKREFAIFGMAIGTIACLLAWLLHVHNPILFLVLTLFGAFGAGVFNMLVWAMITDVIDYQELLTGERDNGTVYATYAWARKLGQALAVGVVGWLLSAIGYQSSQGHHVQQSAATVNGIYNIATLGAGLLFGALTSVMVWWYPLSRDRVLTNAEALAQRRGSQHPDRIPGRQSKLASE